MKKKKKFTVNGQRPTSTHLPSFINMFTRSSYLRRSQKRKMTNNLTVIFVLLGSTHVKAACKTLMKLTPELLNCGHRLP